MNCPKCNSDMEKITYETIQVDRCTHCKGLWFDALEADKLRVLKGSESIDTGDPKTGKNFNTIDRINCPVCKAPMIRMVDPRQHHLWFESCKACHGIFFDAGEFRDYKEKTLLDFFRDLATGERR
jgi:uncharacterized protein